ncbi:ZrgA family zinc uptake protein [Zhongshania sp.]|jgi:hypothetical protein|uniref:ZrgA family zinc uptake protein n=1 Tax=Zhongshania sp. TaxID=1971902 RepID=UPI0039E70598
MMIAYCRYVLTMLFLLTAVAFVNAQEQELSAATNLAAHTHGIAILFVALEGEQLEIEFRSPAVNILGFEHRAKNSEQQAAVNKMKNTLAAADTLFLLDAARCELIDYDLNYGGVSQTVADNNTNNTLDDHQHDHEPHKKSADHRDIEALYHYRCQRPEQLTSLTTTILLEFPNIQFLQVQWIVKSRQGAITLDNNQLNVNFR